MHQQLWIESVGELIIARLRGEPTEALLRECQEKIVQMVRAKPEIRKGRVLYDVLEMIPPSVDVPWSQRELDEALDVSLRRAIVVPGTKLAYPARLAFGEGDYRVFYNDKAAAIKWLDQ